jgi:hypothetical protein
MSKTGKKQLISRQQVEHSACLLLITCFLLGSLFDPEDGDDTFLQNVAGPLPNYTAL